MAIKKKPTKKRPAAARPIQLSSSQAAVERELDAIEEAILRGDGPPSPEQLERLATNQRRLSDALAQRLVDGRAKIPLISLELLTMFGGQRAETNLRRVAEAASVPDIVRWGAHRRAGWPERGEKKRRVTFLDSLTDPEGTLVVAANQATEDWPPNGEILEEVLGYLTALPDQRAQSAVKRIAAELGERSSWLLQALLHVQAVVVRRLALDELARLRPPGASAAVERLARTAPSDALRTEATAVVQRLGLRAVGGPGDGPKARELPPVERVLMTSVDSEGGQAILIVRSLGDGVSVVCNVFHDDAFGLKSAYGSTRAVAPMVDDFAEGFEEQGIGVLEVELAAARGAVQLGLEANAERAPGLPPVFELWEPLLHDAYPPRPDEAIIRPELDDGPYLLRDDLVRDGDELADHAFFDSWGFDPGLVTVAMLDAPPPGKRGWTDRQYGPLIAELVNEPTRQRYRRNLRRQGWLLEQAGDLRQRDLALATAAALGRANQAELVKLPFLRRLVENGVSDLLQLALYPPY